MMLYTTLYSFNGRPERDDTGCLTTHLNRKQEQVWNIGGERGWHLVAAKCSDQKLRRPPNEGLDTQNSKDQCKWANKNDPIRTGLTFTGKEPSAKSNSLNTNAKSCKWFREAAVVDT